MEDCNRLDKKRKERNREIEKSEKALCYKDERVEVVEIKKGICFIELAGS